MPPRSVIEIQPCRHGWVCIGPAQAPRVFVLRPQAVQFAQRAFARTLAEIRVRDREGAVEMTLQCEPSAPPAAW